MEKEKLKERYYDYFGDYELGAFFHEIGQNQSAFYYYRKEIEESDFFIAHYNLGILLYERGRYKEAEYHFKKVLNGKFKKFSDYREIAAGAYDYLGLILSKKKHFTEALELIRKAIKLIPNDAKLYYNAACNFYETKNNEKAIFYFKKAISLKPDYYLALEFLGYLLVKDSKTIPEGIKVLEKALKFEPKSPYLWKSLARAYWNQGKTKEAKTAITKATKYCSEKDWKHDKMIAWQSKRLKNLIDNKSK